MTEASEIAVSGPEYWSEHVPQLAQLLGTSTASVLRAPTGGNSVIYLTHPREWASNPQELRDALRFAANDGATAERGETTSRTTAGVVGPVEKRLVYTVEEAAQLLGISRSFAYESVQRGTIPSMRIGRRILVPKAALNRFLDLSEGEGR